jgi:hypothetical protein
MVEREGQRAGEWRGRQWRNRGPLRTISVAPSTAIPTLARGGPGVGSVRIWPAVYGLFVPMALGTCDFFCFLATAVPSLDSHMTAMTHSRYSVFTSTSPSFPVLFPSLFSHPRFMHLDQNKVERSMSSRRFVTYPTEPSSTRMERCAASPSSLG